MISLIRLAISSFLKPNNNSISFELKDKSKVVCDIMDEIEKDIENAHTSGWESASSILIKLVFLI